MLRDRPTARRTPGRARAGAGLAVALSLAGAGCSLTGDLCYLSEERCAGGTQGESSGAGGAPTTGAGGVSSVTSAGGAGGTMGVGGMGGASARRWPDSPTVFCTDGMAPTTPCPTLGQPAHGQDGNFRIDVPTYTTDVFTVEDALTGLVWQREPAPPRSASEAKQYCADLTLKGASDFRLPSRIELASLVDYGRHDPAIDLGAFPGAPSSEFWTSTPSTSGRSFIVSFKDGYIGHIADDETRRVRCVRGAALSAPYIVAPETVHDPRTGLTWQKTGFWMDANIKNPSWLAALDYCRQVAEAKLDGQADWRLPSVKELLTITVDPVAFPDSPPSLFWTSTPYSSDPTKAHVASLGTGDVIRDDTIDHWPVRCVRGGAGQ